MDVKKSYKADLDKRRASAFLLGLVVVLSVFLAVLEFTSQGTGNGGGDDALDDMPEDIEMMPAMQRKDMVAAAPTAASPKLTSKINVVDKEAEDVVDDRTAEKTSSEGDGMATAGNGNDTTAVDGADDQTSALSPVAVDEKDNPLNFQVVERLPECPGGMVEFMKWLTKNLSYPALAQKQNKQGRVLVSFIINKDGTVSAPKVVTSVCPELDREALRVLRMMPKWKPGEDHGKPCRTYFCIPIIFKI